ncbi:unnamed protein product, partial [Effrenium voratum]
ECSGCLEQLLVTLLVTSAFPNISAPPAALLTEGLPPAAQAAAPIAKKVRRAGGTGVGSRALVARVGVPSGPLEGCRVGEARNPGPTETAATPPDLTPATPIGRSRCNVDGLAGAPGETGCEAIAAAGAGQRFPATWSVRSSEAATLLEETPRLDRDEALVQGEAAPGQSGDVAPGFEGRHARTLGHEPRPPCCSWWTRGPPVAAVSAAGNSWLYVPLLHAAVGTLERSAFEAWARQTTWNGWLPMVQLLQEAAPADVGIIRLVLEGQGANQAAARLPDTSRYAVSLPLPAVAAFLVEPDGYFIASVQETLLEIFAGPEAATQLPGCANTFRLAKAARLLDAPLPAGGGAPGAAPAIMSSWRTLRCSAVFVPWHALQCRRADAEGCSEVHVRMRGLLAFALRSGLRLIRDTPGTAAAREAVGWKLFLLAPRMLLAGEWAQLLQPERAPAGELSAAAEPLAPGNEETLRELWDPARRPQSPRVLIPEAVLQHQPHVRPLARRAAPILDSEEDMQLPHH